MKSYSYARHPSTWAVVLFLISFAVVGAYVMLQANNRTSVLGWTGYALTLGIALIASMYGTGHRIETDDEGITVYNLVGKATKQMRWGEVERCGHKVYSDGSIVITLMGSGVVIRWSSSISGFGELTSEVGRRTGRDPLKEELESWRIW